MSAVGLFASLAPYHVLAYGTLMGTEFFQTFIGGIVSYRALPRAQFSALQQQLFPVYFSLQSALPVVVALTYPSSRLGETSSLSGVLAESNRISVLAPLLITFVAGLANKFYIGPETTKVMHRRKAQEVKDGKKSTDPAETLTPELRALNKEFGKIHGISSLLNLFAFIATAWYGFSLGARLQ